MRLVRLSLNEGAPVYAELRGTEARLFGAAPWLGGRPTGEWIAWSRAQLRCPVEPTKIVCIARNYRRPDGEAVREPVFFLKPPSSLIGPEEPVVLPRGSGRVEHEAELAVIIGRRCKHVLLEQALEFVYGYTCACDISDRDAQQRDGQWTLAKGADSFCPVGPWVETEWPAEGARIRCRINGAVRQDGHTSEMLRGISEIVARVSATMTLEPGDLILTGTPSGSACLEDGQILEVEIDGIGTLSCPVRGAPVRVSASDPRRGAILLVGGWKELYQKCHALGFDTTVLQVGSKLKGFEPTPMLRAIEIDTMDVAGCVELARRLHVERRFDAVASFAEFGLESAAHISEVLKLPSNPVRPVALTRDKLSMRRCLQEAGAPSVRFAECESPEQVRALLRNVGGPIILKPARGAGSKGIAKVDRDEAVDAAWTWVSQAQDRVIAEEFLEGPELSVESITFDGEHQIISITEKLTTGSPHFIELGHQLPARLDGSAGRAIHDAVRQLLDAVGHRVGPAHTEVKLTERGVRIVETQTRVGGDRIWEMVELATGYDMLSATLEYLVTGHRLPFPDARRAAAIRFFAPERCTIQSVEGVEEAQNMPGVVALELKARAGDVLKGLAWSESRLGYVLTLGGSVEEAIERAERAASRIRIVHV